MNMNTNAGNANIGSSSANANAGTSNTTEQKAHRKVDSAASSAHDAVDWTADTVNNAKDSLSETGQDMKETQEKWLAAAREYVQENPATSVGIALASGYLLSRIFGSR